MIKTPYRLFLQLAFVAGLSVTVQAETVLLDFGNDDSFRGISVPNPDANGNTWNSVKPGEFFSNLRNIEDAETSVDYGPGAHPTDSYNGPAGATDGGITEVMLLTLDIDREALGNLGVPEAAIDYHAGKLGDPSGYFQINGLNPDGTYTLRFFGSHKYNASDVTRINVFTDSDRLNLAATADFTVGTGAAHNTDTVVEIADLAPSADGIFYIEFGGVDGENFGYLNAMEISTEGGGGGVDPDPDPEPDEGVKLVVAGSSVPTGGIIIGGPAYYHDFDEDMDDTRFGGSEDRYQLFGYAGRLREHLTHPVKPRVPGGSTTEWEFVNVSVPGDNTTLLGNRFEPDVTRQYAAPKTAHAEPDYVILALSMANEGLVFTSDPQSVFDSFRDGMLDLIGRAREKGYYPLVTLVYPHSDYTPEKYALVKEMNLLMNTWGVPAINLLGAIDNGKGQWADGFFADAGHPNFIGHEEMFHAIPPTMFDAIHFDGKTEVPAFPDSMEHVTLSSRDGLSDSVHFTPEHTTRAFTTAFKLRTESTGTVASVRALTTPRFLVDFGPANADDGRETASPDQYGHHWNNWHPFEGGAAVPVGTRLDELVRTDGGTSAVSLEVTTAFGGSNGIQNGGLFGSAGPQEDLLGHLAVETATEDYFFTTSTAGLKVTGLDPEKRYTFRFFGTRDSAGTRETRFRVTGTTAVVNYSPFADIVTSGEQIGSDGQYNGNDRAIGLVSGIQPRSNGEVFVELLPQEGGFAYLGAMEISADDAGDLRGVIEVREGELAYVSPTGQEMVASVNVADNEWHDIALAHRYAQQETILFVDGEESALMRESFEPAEFAIGGIEGNGPETADYQDWAVYRAAWTDAEAAAQAAGNLQHASMEILAPLDDATFTDDSAVKNIAQSRSEAIFSKGPVEPLSYWSDVEADATSGAKLTGLGWIDDFFWPLVFHYGAADWLYVAESFSFGKDYFFAYALGLQTWIWSSDAYGGWYYDYGTSLWARF
jgi:hypothetical protein